ncbi:hypothetical protein HPB50_015364 [Hyalomma asiaticum]|uniref:Uncharacterized protein n=1 Tax=Hyalomma asiaticum TaxID=266040 RepID=A0ACB7RWH6_HYAAI|nr:hypothetical protein HPB50_015364 [Hyalomma asiaticum]
MSAKHRNLESCSPPTNISKGNVPNSAFVELAEKTDRYSVFYEGSFVNTEAEIRCLVTLHLTTGVLHYPRLRPYWKPNTRCDLVASARISRNHLERLRNNLHIVDVNYPDATDRLWKWTLRMTFHFMNLAVVNAWLEYRRDADKRNLPKQLDLLDFTLVVTEALSAAGSKPVAPKRGRPSFSPLQEKRKQPPPAAQTRPANGCVEVEDVGQREEDGAMAPPTKGHASINRKIASFRRRGMTPIPGPRASHTKSSHWSLFLAACCPSKPSLPSLLPCLSSLARDQMDILIMSFLATLIPDAVAQGVHEHVCFLQIRASPREVDMFHSYGHRFSFYRLYQQRSQLPNTTVSTDFMVT